MVNLRTEKIPCILCNKQLATGTRSYKELFICSECQAYFCPDCKQAVKDYDLCPAARLLGVKEHGLTFKKKEPFDATSTKTIKILEPQMLDSTKVKILSDTTHKKPIEIIGSDIVKIPAKTIPIKKTRIDITHKNKTRKQLSFDLSVPDVMKAGTMRNQVITISNKSKSVHNGCFEIRRIEDGIIKLLSIQGVKISPNEKLKFKPAIKLDRTGSNILEFVLMNRIGRTLLKEEKKVSVY